MAQCLDESYVKAGVGSGRPCVGVVFNAPEPGDIGNADGYTTCWKAAGTGDGWQVLVKPLATHTQDSSCRAELYQHGDFTGWKAVFPIGSYNIHKFLGRGAKNDDASSIRVFGSNCVVELYQHGYFKGWKAVFETGDVAHSSWNYAQFLAAGAVKDAQVH